jgi:transcriptional regulator with XRE-family HTH domain
VLTLNYRTNTSLRANALVTLRQQMADFARAERLRDLRDARHLSQEDAAHEIGVSVKSLRAWEKGGGIRWENAKSVALFYGVDPETLVSRERDADDPTPDVLAALSPTTIDELREKLDQVLDQQVALLAAFDALRDGLADQRKPQAPDVRTPEASRD